MARHEHLRIVKLPERFERRKHGGAGPPPVRDRTAHTGRLRAELQGAIAIQQRRRDVGLIDPSLILRVRMTGATLEEDWAQLGLRLLSSDADRNLILFSSNDEMAQFQVRLDAYRNGPPPGQLHPPYNGFVSTIESIGTVEPRDRIGARFREDGFVELEDFLDDATFLVDVELWDLGHRALRESKVAQIVAYVEERDGQAYDQYIGPSLTLLRLNISGRLLQTLLTIEDVASIDQPPNPDLLAADAQGITLPEAPSLNLVNEDAPLIGVIDSGVNAHPFFADVIVGAIGVPEALGTADDFGHGTRISGVALFGDLRAQLEAGTLNRGARLCSAKVVNERGAFDDRRLVSSQMREAISTLNARFGCRIFVIALGDSKRPYDGGKVGHWAATLDDLARELNVVIVVSAGNRTPRSGDQLEQAVTEFPGYLLEGTNRLFEPAGALNVLTVGALAHGEGLNADAAGDVRVRAITRLDEPAPYSRVGPGIGGATKPDLVDIGGTLVFDPVLMRLRRGEDLPAAGVLTTHHNYLDRLFTSGSGTSYAAPRVAFAASQVLARFPHASANLVRALLVGSAEIPDAARARFQGVCDDGGIRSVCGYGKVDLERAAFSDDARVVLYAEDELDLDHFAVYQIPVPEIFQTERGDRCIRVTLAFDPPVRHTRNDYAGVGMSFRLVRGCAPELIFDHYRRRTQQEGAFPDLEPKYNCALLPGSTVREKGTVQSATVTFKRSLADYGSDYYLVVRCESGWSEQASQRYAVVVEISHKAEIQLYQRIRQRVRLPA